MFYNQSNKTIHILKSIKTINILQSTKNIDILQSINQTIALIICNYFFQQCFLKHLNLINLILMYLQDSAILFVSEDALLLS